MPSVVYETLARLYPSSPVDRIEFIVNSCVGKKVIDIGCYDETALIKRGTDAWLHSRISNVAESVIGVDSSKSIPLEGIRTASNAQIFRGNGLDLDSFSEMPVDVVVAGEFIEHIDQPVDFMLRLRRNFPGRRLILSTPNGVCLANTVLGSISREAQHPDHIHVFTYKILNTLCMRAEFNDYRIIPYHFFATEMLLRSDGSKRIAVKAVEHVIRFFERRFPLLSFGYIVDAKL